MRVCNCTGYKTNPGGMCCQDLNGPQYQHTGPAPAHEVESLEDTIRRVIQDELKKAGVI